MPQPQTLSDRKDQARLSRERVLFRDDHISVVLLLSWQKDALDGSGNLGWHTQVSPRNPTDNMP